MFVQTRVLRARIAALSPHDIQIWYSLCNTPWFKYIEYIDGRDTLELSLRQQHVQHLNFGSVLGYVQQHDDSKSCERHPLLVLRFIYPTEIVGL